jgi:hypothetical protein
VDVKIYSPDLTRAMKKLERGSPFVLRAEIMGGFIDVAPRARRLLREAARDLPAKGRKHTGLRNRTALAIKSDPTVRGARELGLTLGIDRRRMGSQRTLPAHMNKGSWRHPLFGDKDHWYVTKSRKGWFSITVESRIVPMMHRAMERSARKIAENFTRK